jgi:hypothetical protein
MSAYDVEQDNQRLLEALVSYEQRQRHDFLSRMAKISAEMIRRQKVVKEDERTATGQPAA